MAKPQFNVRRLFLLMTLIAVWCVAVLNYTAFLGSGGSLLAYLAACGGLSSLVIIAAASVMEPVATLWRLTHTPMSASNYSVVKERLHRWFGWLGAFFLPILLSILINPVFDDSIDEFSAEAILTVFLAYITATWIGVLWYFALIIVFSKTVSWKCPICSIRFTGYRWRKWPTECAHCHVPLVDLL